VVVVAAEEEVWVDLTKTTDADVQINDEGATITVRIVLRPTGGVVYDEDGERVDTGAGTVSDAIVHEAARLLLASAKEAILREVRETLDCRIRDEVTGLVRAEVAVRMTEGWKRTNEWGAPKGELVTLRSRIPELLSEQVEVGDYPHKRRVAKIEAMISAEVERVLKVEFAKEIASARDRFKSELDARLIEKVAEAIRSAIRI
jgi:hypothetical protein